MKLLWLLLLVFLTSCLGGGELNNQDGTPGVVAPTIPSDTPVFTGTNPSSPAINSSPSLIGTAEADAIVRIYTDSTCSNLAGTTTADGSGNFTFSVNVEPDTSQTFYAAATAEGKLQSDCVGTGITYRNNTINNGMAWLQGSTTTAPSNSTRLNQATAYAIEWQASEFDSNYYSHSTTTDSHRLTFEQGGDYLIAVTLPLIMTSGTYRPVTRLEVRVNGVLIPHGVGESSYIRYLDQEESSSHAHIFLRNISQSDFLEIFVQETAGQDGSEIVSTNSSANLYIEAVPTSRNVFSATATRTAASTNLTLTAASGLEWTSDRKDLAFEHSDGSNSENITLKQAGSYLIFVNVPVSSNVIRNGPELQIKLNNTIVDGGQAMQAYMRGDSGHLNSSLHWSGMIHNVNVDDILTIETIRGNVAATTNVSAGTKASVFAEYFPNSENIISLRATTLSSGNNWNPAAPAHVLWKPSDLHDTSIFTHSTVLNPDQILVNEPGDYLLVYNDVLRNSGFDRTNPKVSVLVNGIEVSGAETKTHYARNTDGHLNSSASLVFLLRNLNANDRIQIRVVQEGIAGLVNDNDDALLSIIKK